MKIVVYSFLAFWLFLGATASSQLVDSVWVNRVEGPPGALVPMEVWLQWPRDSLSTFEVKLTWNASVCTVEAVTMNPFPGYVSADNIDNSVPFAHLGGAHLFGDYIGPGNHLAYTIDFRILDATAPPCSTYVDTVEAPRLSDPYGSVYYAAYGGNYLVVPPQFIRSDANADSTVTMSDAIYTLKHLYVPGSDPPPCMKTADSDDNGEVAMSDAIYTLKYLYVPGAPPPPAPFPDCGVDPTADGLGCEEHPCMEGRQTVKKKMGSVR